MKVSFLTQIKGIWRSSTSMFCVALLSMTIVVGSLRSQSICFRKRVTSISNLALSMSDKDEFSVSIHSTEANNKLLMEYAASGNCHDADNLFKKMMSDSSAADQQSYELLMQSWVGSKSSTEKKAEETESVFHSLMKAGFIPSGDVTVSLINLLGDLSQPEKAENIFDRISFAGGVCDIAIYNSLMIAWGKSKSANAALKAEELLERIEFSGLSPNSASFEALLLAWAESSREDAAIKCVKILENMVELKLIPSIEAFERAFSVLADSSVSEAPEIGMKLLGLLTDTTVRSVDKAARQKSSIFCYESLIAIWLKSGYSDAANAIGRLVAIIESAYPSLDLTKVNLALAISLCNSTNKKSKLIDIAKADERIAYMERKGLSVPAGMYVLLVDSWCNVGNPQRAEDALDRLSSVLLTDFSPRSSPINRAEDSRQSKLQSMLLGSVKVTALPWNQVIAAYGALKISDTSENEEAAQATPPASSSNSSNSSSSSEEDVFLLFRARNADRVYSKLLHLSAQISRERRERTIGELSALSGVRPDRWTFSALVSIWASCGRLDKAEEKLSLMMRNGIRPTSVTYAALIRGWLSRYSAACAIAATAASSTLLTLDPVSDMSGFYSESASGRSELDKKDIRAADTPDADTKEGGGLKSSTDLELLDRTDLKVLIDTALSRVKKIFTFLCRHSQSTEERDLVGVMLGLEDSDGAYYCQDAFNRIVDAGILPTLDMYKEVLRMLSKEDPSSVVRSNSTLNKADRPLGSEQGVAISTADRAVTLFQHLVGVGGYNPDLECYELLVRAFELSSLSLKSSSSRLTQTYPSRALEVAEHMLSTGITPSRSLYESLLRMWVVSRRPDSPRIAESIFRSMVSCTYSASAIAKLPVSSVKGTNVDSDADSNSRPSQSSFLLLLEAWARSPLPNAASKAEEVVQTMLEAGVPPDQRAFSLLAYVWSKSWRWESSSGPVIFTRGPSSGPGSVTDSKSTTNHLSNAVVDQVDLDDRTTVTMSVLGEVVQSALIEGENIEGNEILPPLSSAYRAQGGPLVSPGRVAVTGSSSLEGQQLELPTVHRKKGDFVIRTEDVLHRCLASGLTPDVSLRRSLLSVWCRDRQTSSGRTGYSESSDTVSSGSGDSPSAASSLPQSGKALTSVQKAEELLARISVLSCVQALKELDPTVQVQVQTAEPDAADSLATKMISLDTEESIDSLLPHPSVYMQLAAAWNDERQSYSTGSSTAVKKAQSFLARVNRDIDALTVFSVHDPQDGGYEESTVQGSVSSDSVRHTTDQLSQTPTEGLNAVRTVPAAVRSRGLYIACNLLLAAHALASTGTMHCHEAETIYKKMTGAAFRDLPLSPAPSPPLSSTSISAVVEDSGPVPVQCDYPAADVVSANLLVEGIRLSGGKGIVERCEQLWFSDLGSGITPSTASSRDGISSPKSVGSSGISSKGKGTGIGIGTGELESPGRIYPNDYTFELMSKIWVENRCKDIATRSQNLFDRLRYQAESRGVSRQPYFLGVPVLSPSVASYSTLVEVWSDLDPQRATEIVDRMTDCGLAPAYQVYSRLMETWAKKGRRDKCDSVLLKMLSAGYKPDPLSCRLLLNVHASTDLADSAERTEETLQRLLQAGVRMDEHLLISQLQAWSKSKSPLAANKAEAALAKGLANGVRPSAPLFNVLLDTHGKSRQPDSPERAEGVLRRMKDTGITPEICSYNAAIAAWGRSYRKDAEERSAKVFEQALSDGARPNVITFSSLLSALSRSRDKNAPLRADAVFERMQDAGVEADTVAWTIMITIWSRSKLSEKESKVQEIFERMLAAGAQPSEVTYTALLSMWGNSRHPRASERVVEVFQHMRSAGRRLDTVGYSSLLSALSRSRDKNAPYRANEVFEQMLGAGIRADPMAWTILITLWSKSSIPNKENKVQQIFKRMVASGEQPNAVTYTSLLIMWSKCRSPVAKERILAIYDRIWNEYVRLDGVAFEVLISSLRYACPRLETLQRVDALMARLADFEMPPDARAWSCVIDADSYSGPGCQCHVRALRLYRRMTQSGVKPTMEVFNSVLAAIKRSGDASSPAITEAIIAQMSVYGMTPAPSQGSGSITKS